MNGSRLRPWVVRGEQALLSRPPYVEITRQCVELPDGRLIDDFYQIAMPDFTCVYPETTDGHVLLLRSYRHGPRRICLTFPGGQLSTGEAALAGAQRELLEETGYEADRWAHLGSFITQANQRCQTAHFFRAYGCRKSRAPDSGDLEEQEIMSVTPEDLLAAFGRGDFPIVEHVTLLSLATHPLLGR